MLNVELLTMEKQVYYKCINMKKKAALPSFFISEKQYPLYNRSKIGRSVSMKYFLLLVVIAPACELGLLIWSGKVIGLLPTILMIIATGIGGAYLAKYQGLLTIKKVQEQMTRGIMPGEEMVDGMCILLGGVLLLAPGFITDLIGLLLLLPPTRHLFKPAIMKFLRKKTSKNTITIIN